MEQMDENEQKKVAKTELQILGISTEDLELE